MFTNKQILIIVLLIIIIAFGLSCTSKPTLPIDDQIKELKEKLAKTPRPNQEAEEMALWLSGALVAPEDLYNRIDTSLKDLRELFKDSVSALNSIKFIYPKQPSYISIRFDSIALLDFRDSNYTEWDSLNSLYQVKKIIPREFISFFKVILYFKGILDSDSLSMIYQQVNGISNAYTSHYAGDWSCIYPWIKEDGKLTFLLREAWGDCPSGCINANYWYFVENENGWKLIGVWEDQQTEIPSWWEEAKEAIDSYFYSLSH